MSKLTFNIVEITEGESRQDKILEPEDLDLSPYTFIGGGIEIHFNRQRQFIEVNYEVRGGVELTCDRSLKPFEHPVETTYSVIFKTDVQQETEDENGAVRRFNFSNNTFSIEKEVRDSVLLKIPIKKIHPKFRNKEGEIEEFEPKSFGKAPEDEEEKIDPRWKKLKEIKTED